MNTPVLFLIFNRPDTTIRVFETIRLAKPKKLYVAADGPRPGKVGELEKCEATRAIINNVDWECKVETLFRDTNLGCGKAVSQAITWFFENEEEGIILEDDILPHPDFFPYCEELLEKYRYSDDVGIISGRNYLFDDIKPEDSYYFSSIAHIWGWATWRRTWSKYTFDLSKIKKRDVTSTLKLFYDKKEYRNFWKLMLLQMRLQPIDTWDYQLVFSLFVNRLLSIVPAINLVENIGFGEDATHTTVVDKRVAEYTAKAILPLSHPSNVCLNKKIDEVDIINNNRKLSFSRLMFYGLKLRIKTCLRKK